MSCYLAPYLTEEGRSMDLDPETWEDLVLGNGPSYRKQESDDFQANVWHQTDPWKVKCSILLKIEEFWRPNQVLEIIKK